ncbi:MAG: hypothetical protein ACERKN_18420 [Velocimicrobium sp.]
MYDTTKQNISAHLINATDIYATAMDYNVKAPTTKENMRNLESILTDLRIWNTL